MPGRHQELKRAIRAARHEAGIESDQALALAAGVHLQTIQNWSSGKTTPRPHEMSKLAKALDKPMDYFMSIYEGREPAEQPLHEAVAELTVALRELIAEMRAERSVDERRPSRSMESPAVAASIDEGARRAQERLADPGRGSRVPRPPRRPHGTGAGPR